MGLFTKTAVFALLLTIVASAPQSASQLDFNDFLVNDDTTGGCSQSYPAVAKDSVGNTVVVWTDYRSGKEDIFAQRFDPTGAPLGDNFKVNNPPPFHFGKPAIYPAVAANNNGAFVVVWTESSETTSVFGQIYDTSGTPVGSNFVLGSPEKYIQFGYADVAIDDNGYIYVTWEDDRSSYPGENIFAQRVDPTGVPIGSDFKVNDDLSGAARSAPGIACDSSGNFTITWSDIRTGSTEVYLQRYNSAGVPIGSNIVVNDSITASQKTPDIAMNSNGDFTVTWEDTRNGNFDIFARRFDSTGTPIGTDFIVNDDAGSALQYTPFIEMCDAGDFVICWRDNRSDIFSDIYAQRFDTLGTPVGANIKVNDDMGTTFQFHPAVSIDNQGHCTIAWRDSRNGETEIYAQNYDQMGLSEGPNYEVSYDDGTKAQQYASAAIGASGNLIITWQDERSLYTDIYAQLYNRMGSPIGANFRVNDDPGNARQHHPSVGCDSSGNFVIAWGDERDVQDSKHIYAQLYNSAGIPMGANFKVNDSASATLGTPSIARNKAGRFVIAWSDGRSGITDIYAQIFDSSGNPVGSNFNVVDDTANKRQYWCEAAIDGNGNFVIVWEDERNDDVSHHDIYAQRFDSDGNPLGSNFRVNDDTSYIPQYSPVVAMNDSGTFVIAWRHYTSEIYAQRYEASGAPFGSNLWLAPGYGVRDNLSIILDNSNIFTIAWQENCKGTACFEDLDVFAQMFSFNGNPIDSLFFVPDPAYEFYNQASPHVVASSEYLYIAWQDNRRLKGWDIYAKLYDLSTLVPTYLHHYAANYSGGAIHVEWTIESTEATPRFTIFRKHEGSGSWQRLTNAHIDRDGERFFYLDRNILLGESYKYMVQVDEQSGPQTLFVTEAVQTIAPLKLSVRSYPNPFNPTTNILYSVPKRSHVTLEVFDINGRKIVTLVNRLHKSGEHKTRWEGLNASNNPVSSGVYFLRLTAGKRTISTKVVLLR